MTDPNISEKRKLEEFMEKPQERGFYIERSMDDKDQIDEEKRTVWINFSSEEQVLRWFGYEVLGHGEDEIDLTRLVGAALLVNHNPDDQVGVVEEVRIDGDLRGRALVRFGKSKRASEIFNDVVDGIRRQVSVGYFIKDMRLEQESDEGPDVYRVTRWQPYELSIVSVAADFSVGVGRQLEKEQKAKKETPQKEGVRSESDATTSDVKNKGDDMSDKDEKEPTVDVKTVENSARQAEQNRTQDILAAGEKFGCLEMALDYVRDQSKSVEDLHVAILEQRGQKATKAEDPSIGMDDKETANFSFLRLMDALADRNDKRAQEAAAFELEACRAAAKKMQKDTRGFLVPFDVLNQKRDFTVGTRGLTTGGSAGNLVATDLQSASFIDILINAMVVRSAGAIVLDGLNGNLAIPRQIGGAATYWVTEGSDTTPSDQVFDQVTMQPHSISAATEITRRTLQQSSLSMENFIRMDLAQRMALGIDLAAINGSGVGAEPLGIMGQTGVGNSAVGGTDGGAPTWSHVVKMETDVSSANAAVAALAYLTNSKVRGKLKETEKFSGGGREIWGEGNTLNGYPGLVSNQVPSNLTKGTGTNLSASIFGNFADLIIGMWGGLDLINDPYTKALSGGVRFVAFQDVDVNVRHPESFSVMDDIITD